MYDTGKVIAGLGIFIAFITFPIWFNLAFGDVNYRPDPQAPKDESSCVESKEYMKAWHMDLLNDWRNAVVRDGQRMYLSTDNKKHPMSLSLNCMKCHRNKEKFCDQCHNYIGVDPFCWDCHVEPEGE